MKAQFLPLFNVNLFQPQLLLFSLLPSILMFDFDLIFGLFLTFLALMGYFWCCGRIRKLFWGTHVEQQLLFSLLPSILMFDFDLIFGLFLPFLALMGYFWVQRGAQKLFWVPLM